MQTARDWLADKGLAKRGTRGKFSNAAHAALNEALASGTKFSDWPKRDIQVQASTGESNVETRTVRAVAPSTEKHVADLAPDVYPEVEYRAYELRDGRKVERSMRSACQTPGTWHSLTHCTCPEPVIVATDGSGSVRVYIERR